MSALAELTLTESDLLRESGAAAGPNWARQAHVERSRADTFASPYIISGWMARTRQLSASVASAIRISPPAGWVQ